MNFQTIKWTAIICAICVAYWKIFGSTGVVVSIVIAALILLLLYTYQNKILYIPDIPNAAHSPKHNPDGYIHPSQHGLNTENVEIATSDNIRLRGWLIRGDNTERILVYFHENAGNLGFRIPFLKNLFQRTNSDILFIAYRGFSDSDGKPTEEGLQLDAQAVLSYAINYRNNEEKEGRKKDIFVLGRSLGGAVSIYIASHENYNKEIKGLILQNTFTSIQDMVKVLFPVLSHIQFLHRNFWPSLLRIGFIQTPILFIRSLRDEIVPTAQMQQLIEAATACSFKMQHEIENGTHNVAWDADPPKYFAKVNEFFGKFK